jgi:hypothetical protein
MANEPVKVDRLQHPFGVKTRKTNEGLARQITFPASPAFVNNYKMHKDPNVPKMTDVVAKKNIPFNVEEQCYYKIKQEKQRFKQFAHSINACFETGRPSEVEVAVNGITNFQDHLYMPLAVDSTVTAKMQRALKRGGRGLSEVPASFFSEEATEGDKRETRSSRKEDKGRGEFP